MTKGEIPDTTVGGYPDTGWPPTAAEQAGRALADWIADHHDRSSGGVWVLKDRTTVAVYWKGAVPAGLRRLAARQPVPVTFKPAPYSLDELNAAIDAVIANNPWHRVRDRKRARPFSHQRRAVLHRATRCLRPTQGPCRNHHPHCLPRHHRPHTPRRALTRSAPEPARARPNRPGSADHSRVSARMANRSGSRGRSGAAHAWWRRTSTFPLASMAATQPLRKAAKDRRRIV